LRERFLLGVAQFGELLGDMRDRAVVLADLDTVSDRARGRRESGARERIRNGIGGLFEILGGLSGGGLDLTDDCLDAAPGEVGDRSVSTNFAQLTHRCTGKIVIGVAEAPATLGGDLEVFGGASATTMARRTCGRFPGLARLQQRVEVATYTRGTETEPSADLRRRDGPILEQEFHHGRPGVTFVAGGDGRCSAGRQRRGTRLNSAFLAHSGGRIRFHNTSVTEFRSQVY
jgi:hypothetical protein